jgi:malonyl CoA-acyl carrier protein transacylase
MLDVIETCDVIIECGPGNVLSKMAKRAAKDMGKSAEVQIFKASSAKDIEDIKHSVIG